MNIFYNCDYDNSQKYKLHPSFIIVKQLGLGLGLGMGNGIGKCEVDSPQFESGPITLR